MGRAKVEPIFIQMKLDSVHITQPCRPIPKHYKAWVEKKINDMLENGLIEGPLDAKEAT